MEYSILNYIGYPEMYRNLPSKFAHIQKVYEQKAEELNEDTLYWGVMLSPVMEARKQVGEFHKPWDKAAFRIAVEIISSKPFTYFKIWTRVITEYLSSYFVLYGLFHSHEVVRTPENSQVPRWSYNFVTFFEGIWNLAMPFLSAAAIILPLILLVRPAPATEKFIILIFWALIALIAVVNTAIEPMIGQARYRMPLQEMYLVVASSSLFFIFGSLSLKKYLVRLFEAIGDLFKNKRLNS